MDSFIFPVAIFTKEILFKIRRKDMVKCFGLMEVFIRVNGKMERKMEKAKYIYPEKT